MTSFRITISVHSQAETPLVVFKALAVPLILHPLGWRRQGYTFTIVDACDEGAQDCIRVMLTPDQVIQDMFPDFNQRTSHLSVCNLATKEVFINEARWYRTLDDDASGLELPAYRAYVLNHEIGHAIGKDKHEKCGGPGERTPIMMQQTLGHGKCVPYPFPSKP